MKREKGSAAGCKSFGRALTLSLLLSAGSPTHGASFADNYDSTLQVLLQQGPDAAAARLIEGRPRVANGTTIREWEERRRQQGEAAERLVAVAPECLMPLIDLHDRAQLELRRRGMDEAADQERTTVYLIADLLARQVLSGDLRRVVSDVFAVLAGDFHRRSPGPTAADLYQRSLRFDFSNPAATSGLALVFESNGRYRRALPFLELQFAFDPLREEASLRRAVNLRRAGRATEATIALQSLARTAEIEWIAAIAIQELARAALNEEDLPAARRIVQRGLDRLGSEPTLTLLAIYLDERLDSSAPVDQETLRPIESAAPGSQSSRYRYAELSEDLLHAARNRVRSAAEAARPRLAEAVAE